MDRVVFLHLALLDEDRSGDGQPAAARMLHAFRVQFQRNFRDGRSGGGDGGHGNIFPIDVLLQLIAHQEGPIFRLEANLKGAGLDKARAALRIHQRGAQYDSAAHNIANGIQGLAGLFGGDIVLAAAGNLGEFRQAFLIHAIVIVEADAIQRHLRAGNLIKDAFFGVGLHFFRGIVFAIGDHDHRAASIRGGRQRHRIDHAFIQRRHSLICLQAINRLVQGGLAGAVHNPLGHHFAKGDDGSRIVRAEILHKGMQALAHVLHHGRRHRPGYIHAENIVDALLFGVERLNALHFQRSAIDGNIELIRGKIPRNRAACAIRQADIHRQIRVSLLYLVERDGACHARGQPILRRERQRQQQDPAHNCHSFHRLYSFSLESRQSALLCFLPLSLAKAFPGLNGRSRGNPSARFPFLLPSFPVREIKKKSAISQEPPVLGENSQRGNGGKARAKNGFPIASSGKPAVPAAFWPRGGGSFAAARKA